MIILIFLILFWIFKVSLLSVYLGICVCVKYFKIFDIVRVLIKNNKLIFIRNK